MSDIPVYSGLRPKVVSTSVTNTATLTPNFDTDVQLNVTAQPAAITIANPTGTGVDGQKIIIRLKDNGFSCEITFGSMYRGIVQALPITTIPSKTMYMGFVYNSADVKMDLVAFIVEP